MSYRIVTDTCCDFPEHMYEELGLTLVRLSVNFKGQNVNTYSEKWLKKMFDGLRQHVRAGMSQGAQLIVDNVAHSIMIPL